MDLVDKQYGTAVKGHQASLSLIDLAAQVLYRTGHGRYLDKLAARMRGYDMGERGLARTRRTVQDHARHNVVLDGGAQPRPRADGLLLTDVIIKAGGPHAYGEWRVAQLGGALMFRKQSIHANHSSQRGDRTYGPNKRHYTLADFVDVRPAREL